MIRPFAWIFLVGFISIWSAIASAQATGQPAAPPPVEQPAVQPLAPPTMQPAPPPGLPPGVRKGTGPRRFFDPNTVETLKGEVVSIQRGPMRQGGKGNLARLTLQTDKGPVQVFLGPAPFVDAQSVKLAAGDKVEVKASRQTGAKGRVIYTAAEVMKGGQVLKLRDNMGTPLWPRGQGKRRPVPVIQ